ncbi:MAG: tail fiber protein, partial [Alphaproteobacteria bacterium]|nr:tail fiber protein [Alphaproteobacteria bacterium]
MAEPFLGEIRIFAGNYAPEGWHFCDGSLLSVSNNDALFALLGTTYGGDGASTFGLPDLRGRVALSMGQGPGLQNYTAGQKAGSEMVTLTIPNIPAHSHTLNAAPANATTATAGPTVVLAAAV